MLADFDWPGKPGHRRHGRSRAESKLESETGGTLSAIQRIQDHGITVNGCFILGLDGSGPETFEAIWRFIQETALFEVQLTVLTPFAGTPLYQRLEREDRLLYPKQWNRCTLFDVNFRPNRMTVGMLETGLRDLMAKVYNKEFITWRRNQFFDRLRQRHRNSRGGRGADADQFFQK